MQPEIEADGDRWQASLDAREPHPGVRAVVFHCRSRDQRPYRVAEVPEERVPSQEALAELSEDELREIFAASGAMDVTHDRKADPGNVGTGHPIPGEEPR